MRKNNNKEYAMHAVELGHACLHVCMYVCIYVDRQV